MSSLRRYFVQNFGCRATQADGAAIEAELSARGLSRVSERRIADLVVVNTCTVTAQADQDARQAVRRVHRENPDAEILITGCYAQRRPEELASLAGVRWVVGNSHKTQIGEIVAPQNLVSIAGVRGSGAISYHGRISQDGIFVGDVSAQRELLSQAVLDPSGDRSRPNLKVQDGCNNRCSFCIIPAVRGLSRSAPAERVVAQVGELERYPEVVLTGINLGRWGRDLEGRPRFVALLRRILNETAVRKLRISSVEPMDWSAELLELVAGEERICKHVHVPLQSGCDRTLRAMRRPYRVRHYADRLQRARTLMPDAAIGADVMVGFPGETEADFDQSQRFIESMPFTYLHVFTYSAREGTDAAGSNGQVPKSLKKERNRALRELSAAKNLAFRKRFLGRRLAAVSLENGRALTDNFISVSLGDPHPAPATAIEVEPRSVDSESTFALDVLEQGRETAPTRYTEEVAPRFGRDAPRTASGPPTVR